MVDRGHLPKYFIQNVHVNNWLWENTGAWKCPLEKTKTKTKNEAVGQQAAKTLWSFLNPQHLDKSRYNEEKSGMEDTYIF